MTVKRITLKRKSNDVLSSDGEDAERIKDVKASLGAEVSEEEGADEAMRNWTRLASDEEEASAALPVRTETGKWKTVKRKPVQSNKGDKEGSEKKDRAKEDAQIATSNTKEETRSLSFDEAKKEIGILAVAITEAPEENIGKLRQLLAFSEIKTHSADVVRLGLVSAVAIFKDILPGYYIRPLSEAEKTANVSKDVKRTRSFEESILNNYTRLYSTLKSIIWRPPKRSHKKSELPILTVALSCLFELMQFTGHFNLFEDILKLAAHSMTLPFEDEVERACQAFRRLFDEDQTGLNTMLAVRLVSNMIKEMNYDCPAVWLTALETIRLKADVAGRSVNNKVALQDQRKKKHISKREKKELKAKKAELSQLAEAEALSSREDLAKWNRESLKFLFRIYFGILKTNPSPQLLPETLAGLSRHSHRISIEYFADLIRFLKQLMDRAGREELDIPSALHCVLTVDRIHAINENLAAMDLKSFYNCLFRQIRRIGLLREGKADWDVVQKPLQACLTNLFHSKRILPTIRVASFVQRLADVAGRLLDSNMTGPAVLFIENILVILTNHPKAQSILDREPFGQGVYLTECDDPDLCNPYTRSLYDVLVALKNQSQPRGKLQAMIDNILRLAQ